MSWRVSSRADSSESRRAERLELAMDLLADGKVNTKRRG